jgi:hypothetical protein
MMSSGQQLFIVFGLAVTGFLVAGLASWFRTRRYIDRSHKAIGVVIKVKKIPFQNKDTFSPVIRFTTSDGRALSFTDPLSKYPPEFELGENAQVLYDPQNPHKARAVKRTSDLFILAKLFGVAGAAVLAVGLVLGMVSWLLHNLPGPL